MPYGSELTSSPVETEKRKQVIKAARFGKYYCPATDHYGNANTTVSCDDCERSGLIDSFGFDGERIDVCVDCTRKIRLHLAKLLLGKVDDVVDTSLEEDELDGSEAALDDYEQPSDDESVEEAKTKEVKKPCPVPTVPIGTISVPRVIHHDSGRRTKMRQSMFKPTLPKTEAPYLGNGDGNRVAWGAAEARDEKPEAKTAESSEASETEEPTEEPVEPTEPAESATKKRKHKSQEPVTLVKPASSKPATTIHFDDGSKWESTETEEQAAAKQKGKGKLFARLEEAAAKQKGKPQQQATRMRQTMMGGRQ